MTGSNLSVAESKQLTRMVSGASTTASDASSNADSVCSDDMPDISVIAFSGPKRVGKTTASRSLKKALEQRGINVEILSFAGPIKVIAKQFGFPEESLYGTEAEKEAPIEHLGMSGRKFMQDFGTELMRKHFSACLPNYVMVEDCNIWSTMLYRKLQSLPDGTVAIIDDLRFPGEAKMLKNAGATIVSLSGGNSKPAKVGEPVHASEKHFEMIERDFAGFHIKNNLTDEFSNRIAKDFLPVVSNGLIGKHMHALWECAPAEHEPLLMPPKDQYVVLNPTFPEIHALASKQSGGVWQASEFTFENDKVEFSKADSRSQNSLATTLGFFNVADPIIAEHYCSGSIIERLGHHPEIRKFGFIQGFIEEEHSETYSNATRTILPDSYYDQVMSSFLDNTSAIGRKIDLMKTYLVADSPIQQTLFCDALLEGIGFAASFNVVFFLGDRGRFKQLVDANVPISRDEGLHASAAVAMYNKVNNRLTDEDAVKICKLFTEAEIAFAERIYNGDNMVTGEKYDPNTEPEILKGMPLSTTVSYIKFLANVYMSNMGHPKPYPEAPAKSPCPWMDQTSIESQINTFERVSGDYRSVPPPKGTEEDQEAAFAGTLGR